MRRMRWAGLNLLLIVVAAASILSMTLPSKPSLGPTKTVAPEAQHGDRRAAESAEARSDRPDSTRSADSRSGSGSHSVSNSGSAGAGTQNAAPPAPLAGKVIAIDPGHGGWDRGARGPGGSHEADNTLATALITKEVLEEAGAKVILTRTGDYMPGVDRFGRRDHARLLRHRVEIAEGQGADVLVSIHNDANHNRAIKGTTTYYWSHGSLAAHVQEALVQRLKSRNVGVMRAPFVVLRTARIPAVLVEIGFISNPDEEALLGSEQYQRLAAQGLRDGLIRYFHG